MLLSNAPLYYPSAREWMWEYCMYLGPFTDSKDINFDLGVFIQKWDNSSVKYSSAIVYGDTPGDYISGEFRIFGGEGAREEVVETIRRCKELNLF